MRHNLRVICSESLNVGTYDINIFKACFKDKRYILDDRINTLAYVYAWRWLVVTIHGIK